MRRAGPFFEAVIRLRRFLTIAFVLLAVGATMFARTGGRDGGVEGLAHVGRADDLDGRARGPAGLLD